MARNQNRPDVNLNLNVRGKQLSATLEINERIKILAERGERVYRFGLGQSPFPVPGVVVDELKANAHQKDYLPVLGLHELRTAVAKYHQRTAGIEYTCDDVMIGPGSKELMFILQLVYYGDLVIPTPAWVSYAPQASIIGRKIQMLETHSYNDWRLMPETVEELCKDDPDRPRLIILNYPSNPTGGTYKIDELKAIAEMARKYKVVLLSDEIYGELHYKGQHVSIARYYPEGTIISSGLSKWCGAGGWRLGTFTFPKSMHWLRDAMAVVASETYTSTAAPIQHAAVRAFQGGIEIERYLWQSRRILKLIGKSISQTMHKTGIIVAEPKGAFYLFPDFTPFRDKLYSRGITNSRDLCRRLLEDTGVAFLPGSVFGRPKDELTARLAFVDFDGARALAAAEQIPADKHLNGAFLDDYCTNIINGIDKVCEWVQK
jgi:aspartate aminotransferase